MLSIKVSNQGVQPIKIWNLFFKSIWAWKLYFRLSKTIKLNSSNSNIFNLIYEIRDGSLTYDCYTYIYNDETFFQKGNSTENIAKPVCAWALNYFELKSL